MENLYINNYWLLTIVKSINNDMSVMRLCDINSMKWFYYKTLKYTYITTVECTRAGSICVAKNICARAVQ